MRCARTGRISGGRSTPRVDPVSIELLEDGRVDVEVHQVVRDLDGKLMADSIVHHIYTFDGASISRMEVLTEG